MLSLNAALCQNKEVCGSCGFCGISPSEEGLRVSDVVRLQVRDLESNRMLLRVNHGKGNKDCSTLLSTGKISNHARRRAGIDQGQGPTCQSCRL
jgi:hypothetical protein